MMVRAAEHLLGHRPLDIAPNPPTYLSLEDFIDAHSGT